MRKELKLFYKVISFETFLGFVIYKFYLFLLNYFLIEQIKLLKYSPIEFF